MFFDLTLVAQFLHLGLNAGMSKLPPLPSTFYSDSKTAKYYYLQHKMTIVNVYKLLLLLRSCTQCSLYCYAMIGMKEIWF